jgi:hypothetical protein
LGALARHSSISVQPTLGTCVSYPKWHVQLKAPIEFTQLALTPQYEAPVPTAPEHSSISKHFPEGKHSNPV